MEKIIITLILIWSMLAGITIYGIYTNNKENIKYNTWANKCLEYGGVVMNTRKTFTTESFECIKDGKIINHID